VCGKNKFALKTRVERRADGKLILNGSKFYSTGSYLAEWISLTAASDDGGAGVLLNRNTPGLTLVDDWEAFGQKNSVSGTVIFDNIELDEGFVSQRKGPMKRTGLTFPQILHAAIDTGIAEGALSAAVQYLNHNARPWVESGVAPDALPASRVANQVVNRTRPICAYPKEAKYSGTGSIDDAANFTCQ